MQKHEHLSTAKALIGLLAVSIVAVLFWKFNSSKDYLFTDLTVLRNYVAFAIIGGALLVVLFYHASQTTHPKAAIKSSKSSKSKRKKK